MDVVKILLDRGGKGQLEVRDHENRTVIHAFEFEGQALSIFVVMNILECLLNAGANAEARGLHGFTLLQRAAGSSQLGVVDLLLQHGVDVGARIGITQRTPLHVACASSYIESAKVVRRLLQAGADPNARIYNGKSPFGLAIEKLIQVEKFIGTVKPLQGRFISTMTGPCLQYRAFIDIVLALLPFLTVVRIDSNDFNRSFVFGNIRNMENRSKRQLQKELEAELKFALLSSDEEIFKEVQAFYQYIAKGSTGMVDNMARFT